MLEPEHRAWLASLPKGPLAVDDLVEICHGSPIDEDLYIFDETDALRALKGMSRQLCLFGHTHFPITFQLAGGELQAMGPTAAAEAILELRTDVLYLVNPGAVGQPRDGDARAAYAIVDVDAETGGVGAAAITPSKRRRRRSWRRGCLLCSRSGWRSGR